MYLFGGSPGLVVVGGDSCSKVRIPAPYTGWTFFTDLFVVKFVMCVFEEAKINEKEADVGAFKNAIY